MRRGRLPLRSLTFTAEEQVLLVVADGVREHSVLLTALTRHQDILLGFILVTARFTAEHRNATLQTKKNPKHH